MCGRPISAATLIFSKASRTCRNPRSTRAVPVFTEAAEPPYLFVLAAFPDAKPLRTFAGNTHGHSLPQAPALAAMSADAGTGDRTIWRPPPRFPAAPSLPCEFRQMRLAGGNGADRVP